MDVAKGSSITVLEFGVFKFNVLTHLWDLFEISSIHKVTLEGKNHRLLLVKNPPYHDLGDDGTLNLPALIASNATTLSHLVLTLVKY